MLISSAEESENYGEEIHSFMISICRNPNYGLSQLQMHTTTHTKNKQTKIWNKQLEYKPLRSSIQEKC